MHHVRSFFFCAQPYFIVNDTFRCPKENTGEEEEEIADAEYVSPLGGYKAAREKKRGGGGGGGGGNDTILMAFVLGWVMSRSCYDNRLSFLPPGIFDKLEAMKGLWVQGLKL